MSSPRFSFELVLLLVALSYPHAATALNTTFLDLCAIGETDVIVGTNLTWGAVLQQPLDYIGNISYLRPDVGGALLPYIYTVVLIIVHIPIVIIRVVRWQKVQAWAMAATVLQLVVTIEAYKSTEFQAERILTWTPIMLVIDAGSMAQVLFLIIEDQHLLRRAWQALRSNQRSETAVLLEQPMVEQPGFRYDQDLGAWVPQEVKFASASTTIPTPHPRRPSSSSDQPLTYPPLLRDENLYIALVAMILFFVTLGLQCLGLARAVAALRGSTPMVSYCCPVFQPFGVAVLDGNCNVFPINQNFGKGVGCIKIPGTRQIHWLQATVAGTSLALVLEAVDVVLLTCVHSKTRWRGLKMRRPWCCMIGGLIALGVVLVYGINYAETLPDGISEKIWIVEDGGTPGFYNIQITAGGIRGELLGWTDGVFSSWNQTYFGTPTQLY